MGVSSFSRLGDCGSCRRSASTIRHSRKATSFTFRCADIVQRCRRTQLRAGRRTGRPLDNPLGVAGASLMGMLAPRGPISGAPIRWHDRGANDGVAL